MKEIKYIIILLALTGLVFTSCKDDDLLFDKSSSERVKEASNELHANLMAAPAWKIKYYTDTASYGAYNIIMSFEQNEVTMQGDEIFPSGRYTSSYNISAPQGVSLVFDTYNDVLSMLDDGDETPVTGNGERLGGDHEFIYLRSAATKDTIYFKTKKSQQEVQFIKFDGNWDQYFANIKRMSDLFTEGDMDRYFKEINMEGTTLLLTGYDAIYRTMNPAYLTSNDSLIIQTNGVAFTETGFEFFEPVEIDGKLVQYFVYNDATGRFEIADEGVSGFIQPVSEPTVIFPGNITGRLFTNGEYYNFSAMDPTLLQLRRDILEILYEDFFPNGFDLFNIRFYPTSTTNIYTFEFVNAPRNSEYLYALAARDVQITRGPDRTDKITFAPRPNSGWGYSPTQQEAFEAVRDYLDEFFNIIIGSYIIIPSADFKTYTFGSTDSSTNFTIRYAARVE